MLHQGEEEIVELLARSDQRAIALIYDKYGAALYGVVFKICQQDEAIAQDALQEGLVNVWKNASNYDSSKGRLFTWILNICRNKALDRYRQMKRKSEIQTNTDNVSAFEKNAKTALNTDVIGLKQEVNKLPEEQRILVELAYLQGFTQSQIAEKLNIPLGTIKTRVRTAIMALRKVYVE